MYEHAGENTEVKQVLSERSGFDEFWISDEFTVFPYKTSCNAFLGFL